MVIEINDDKGIRLVSSSLKKHESTPASRQGESSVIMKDPNKKMMLSYKQKPFDLTFTNFKQKIYEKKLSKLSYQKSKYTEEWNEYLNKYYLNIKKVKPLIKYEDEENGNEDSRHCQVNTTNSHYPQDYTRDAKSSAEIMLLNKINNMAAQSRKGNHVNEATEGSSEHLYS